jgi:regulator of replication initiation timing
MSGFNTCSICEELHRLKLENMKLKTQLVNERADHELQRLDAALDSPPPPSPCEE